MIRTLLALIAGALALVLALPAMLVALGLWIVRAITARLADAAAPQLVEGDPFVQFDPEVGWTPRPNLSTHATDLNGDFFHFTTDQDGWRGRGAVEDADVVVFGDSFAFGFGIDDAAFYGNLGREFAIKAVGAPGYNMVQALHWMHALAPKIAGKTLVWFLYPPNDLEDNVRPSMLRYRTPFIRERKGGNGWEKVTHHLSEEPWPFPSRKRHFENYVEICSDSDLSRRVFRASDVLIREAADLARSLECGLVVATVPELSPLAQRQLEEARRQPGAGDGFDASRPDQRIGRTCADLGIPFVALADELSAADYLEKDVHWNAEGHRKVHDVLRRIWTERPPPPSPAEAPEQAQPAARDRPMTRADV